MQLCSNIIIVGVIIYIDGYISVTIIASCECSIQHAGGRYSMTSPSRNVYCVSNDVISTKL